MWQGLPPQAYRRAPGMPHLNQDLQEIQEGVKDGWD